MLTNVNKLPFRIGCTNLLFNQPHSSVGKESPCNAGDLGSFSGSGRSPGEGNGNPLLYSCLENPMDRGAWWATVHEVTRVGHDLRLNHHQFTFQPAKYENNHFSKSATTSGSIFLRQRSLIFLALGTDFVKGTFSMELGSGWFGDYSNALPLLCTLLLLLLHCDVYAIIIQSP